MVNTLTSPPLPTLPLEIEHEILKFCDPSTLAQTSRVSLAFLELSSPLLYTHVEIQGSGQLERMLLARDSSHQPQLSAVLSLDQIKTLTFTEPRLIIPLPSYPLKLDHSSTPTTPLVLQRLTILLPFAISHFPTPVGHYQALIFVVQSILAIFRPIELHIEGITPPRPFPPLTTEEEDELDAHHPNRSKRSPPNLPINRQIAENTHLRSIVLKNAIVSMNQTRNCTIRTVHLEITEDLEDLNGIGRERSDFIGRDVWNALFRAHVGKKEEEERKRPEIVVRVGSEERRRQMLVDFEARARRIRVEGVALDASLLGRWVRKLEGVVRV